MQELKVNGTKDDKSIEEQLKQWERMENFSKFSLKLRMLTRKSFELIICVEFRFENDVALEIYYI